MIFAKDSTARSWVEGSDDTPFPIQNLPYGVFRRRGESVRVGVAIGECVLDLACLHAAGLFDGTPIANENIFAGRKLNDFLALGRPTWTAVRRRIVALLARGDLTDVSGRPLTADPRLRIDRSLCGTALPARRDVEMLLPCRIGDFIDFYASKEHASNVGAMYRDPDAPLPPNWVHLPAGYHGRSGSVVVSGTPVRRPWGQTKAPEADAPAFRPSRMLDFELEMGFFTGRCDARDAAIGTREAPDHVFGLSLVNDWSARDIQRWEYVPLGPFLGKSFATSISPWVVPLDALLPFRVAGPPQDPPVLPYLEVESDWALDIHLEACLQTTEHDQPQRVTETNFRHLYWTIPQLLAHAMSNGCGARAGDLYASGTVSGPRPTSYGCLLEITRGGTRPLTLPSGEKRTFLADGDKVTLRGYCQADSFRVGFGEVAGQVLAARR